MAGHRTFRALVARLALGLAVVLPAAGALAADAPPPMTREAAREMLSRMSDADVRKMMLEQLDRAAVAPAAEQGGMTGMVSQMAGESNRLRDRAVALASATIALPGALRAAGGKLMGERGPSHVAVLAAFFAVMLVAGTIGERLLHRATRSVRQRFDEARRESFAAKAVAIATRLALELADVAVFAIAATAVFFLAWQGHEPSRLAILTALLGVAAVKVVQVVSRLLLAPDDAAKRLIDVEDATARRLHASVVAIAIVFAAGYGVVTILRGLGAESTVTDLLVLVLSTVLMIMILRALVLVRADLKRWIGGPAPRSATRQLFADLVPFAVAAYLLGVYVVRVYTLLAERDMGMAGMKSVLVLIALPLVDAVLCAWLRERAHPLAARDEPTMWAAYEPALRRAIHLILIVTGVAIVADVYNLDLFALAQRGVGERIAGALFGIVIIVLVSYMLWQLLATAIERRMQAESPSGDTPATRLRTLLPLLRITMQATILVTAVLSILAALGVNIVPLLAGASIVGVAIGFGSQTLVRDIVSGAFFMVDDAFRLGEYLEIGDAKGNVERLTIRSVFLRHHRGAINIVPYGDIKRVRNTSRDWMVMVLEFPLTYDTDLVKVKKILKRIGDELKADPDYADDILQPLKSQGVMSTEDSALVVRAKFTAKPGNNLWVIRRVAYQMILKAFAEEGIRFAHRQVTVHVDDRAGGGGEAIGGAAALAIDRERAA